MKPYELRQIGEKWLNVKECEGCERMTTADYCCASCETAHDRGYEIHETGILAHSEPCNQRHQIRGAMDIKGIKFVGRWT